MRNKFTLAMFTLSILLILGWVASGCTPVPVETNEETSEPQDVTSEPGNETAPTGEAEPTTGGTFIFAGYPEPTTLDPALTGASVIIQHLGAPLITLDPEGNYVPYLAESWENSDDGLTWTFHIRNDVKFTDGSPLTAHDYAWTFNRALDPETASPIMPMLLGGVSSIEATDDYTLVMKYNTPFSSLLFNLTDAGYTQPLSQAAFEGGINYQREHVGVGPFKLKEWVTGDHITFERNPEFTWAPEFAQQGPVYLDTIEFRFIPEYATIIAGLEAGEIDATNLVQTQDIQRLKDIGGYDIIERIKFGIWPGLWINVSQSPFDDINVRQALAYALDRESIRDIVYSGYGQVVSGPLNPGFFGYSEKIEASGYSYDVEKAAQLMTESGYSKNDDGMWEKDGQPFSIIVEVGTMEETFRKIAEVVQSQWKNFGVETTLEINESVFNDLISGDYPIAITGVDWADGGEFMRIVFHSESLNLMHASDPQLDELLNTIVTSMDPDARQTAVDQAAFHIMQNAYVITTVSKPEFMVVSTRIGGVKYNSVTGLYFFDMYVK